MAEKSLRRLPLRQLLASSDRTARELAEVVHTHLLPRITDFRDLRVRCGARAIIRRWWHFKTACDAWRNRTIG